MGVDVERIVPPFGAAESIVMGQRALARVLSGPKRATRRKGEVVEETRGGLAGELHLPAWGGRQMGHPVEVGACKRAGGQTSGEPRDGGVQVGSGSGGELTAGMPRLAADAGIACGRSNFVRDGSRSAVGWAIVPISR
jgi:hypothetical protein